MNEVEFINSVTYEESVWMKIHSERGRKALYIEAFLLWIHVAVMRGLKKMYLVLGEGKGCFAG